MSVSPAPAERVRELVLGLVDEPLAAIGIPADELPDDFDLLKNGVIDSFGFLELIAAVEDELGVEVDLAGLDAEHLTLVGPLSRHLERIAAGAIPGGEA